MAKVGRGIVKLQPPELMGLKFIGQDVTLDAKVSREQL